MKLYRYGIVISLVAATLLAAQGCAPPKWGEPDDLNFRIAPSVRIPRRGAIVFFADGINRTVFRKLLAEGKLPHIKKYIVDRGAEVETALASQPTITYANTVSLSTGYYPGHHGVLGNKWFDRHRLIFRDYTHPDTMGMVAGDFAVPTIYEHLGKKFSVAILTQTNRGATHFYENWMRSGILWFFRQWEEVDSATIHRFQNASELAAKVRAWPDLVMAYFPACDQIGHVCGPDSPRYRDAMIHLDLEMGNLLKALEREGILDKLLLVFVSDHGIEPTLQSFDIEKFLERDLKLRATYSAKQQAASYQKRWKTMHKYDVVCAVDAGRAAKLYFRIKNTWTKRPSLEQLRNYDAPVGRIDLVNELLKHEAIGWICYSNGDGAVKVFTRRGAAVIQRRVAGGAKTYSDAVLEGDDPFAYSSDASAKTLVGGGFYTADKWLKATLATPHPDVVSQLPEMFDSPRVGDLVCFASPRWGFGPTPKWMLL